MSGEWTRGLRPLAGSPPCTSSPTRGRSSAPSASRRSRTQRRLTASFTPISVASTTPRSGPSDKFDLCGTCGLNYVHCPGHMGHIALPLPVYHPVFFMSLYQLLRASCWACHRLLAPPLRLALVRGQLELLDRGCLEEAASLEERVVADLGSREA